MNKLKLRIEDLGVESFEPSLATGKTGTVYGHDSAGDTRPANCPPDTAETDWYTCPTCAVWC
jgi:hypothetical protein